MTITFLDFFAGIGGFRCGLELTGMKCIGYCEKDKFARKSYEAMYETKHQPSTTSKSRFMVCGKPLSKSVYRRKASRIIR